MMAGSATAVACDGAIERAAAARRTSSRPPRADVSSPTALSGGGTDRMISAFWILPRTPAGARMPVTGRRASTASQSSCHPR